MTQPTRILLQTTIPYVADDWHIGRFSLLADHLDTLTDDTGSRLYEVTARNREADESGKDPLLSTLDASDFDQLWLFAVDVGDGLTYSDCEGITKFRQRGGGILSARDHNDLGSSLCTLGGIGSAHYFHSKNPDPDITRHRRDDEFARDIDFPNYHSGANGNFQTATVTGDLHPLLRRPDGTAIEFFPAHPHEGGIGAPADSGARVIARSRSRITQRDFNLLVALERMVDQNGNLLGPAIAHSSFHHLVDYNWHPEVGAPSFVEEAPGDEYKRFPARLDDIRTYVKNAASWLVQPASDVPGGQ